MKTEYAAKVSKVHCATEHKDLFYSQGQRGYARNLAKRHANRNGHRVIFSALDDTIYTGPEKKEEPNVEPSAS